jgi:hypothetical protein
VIEPVEADKYKPLLLKRPSSTASRVHTPSATDSDPVPPTTIDEPEHTDNVVSEDPDDSHPSTSRPELVTFRGQPELLNTDPDETSTLPEPLQSESATTRTGPEVPVTSADTNTDEGLTTCTSDANEDAAPSNDTTLLPD